MFAERDSVTVIEREIGARERRSVSTRDSVTTSGRLLHEPRPGNVVCVAMGIEHRYERKTKFVKKRSVAQVMLEHGIDEHRFPR
jgi:hypothetical protein